VLTIKKRTNLPRHVSALCRKLGSPAFFVCSVLIASVLGACNTFHTDVVRAPLHRARRTTGCRVRLFEGRLPVDTQILGIVETRQVRFYPSGMPTRAHALRRLEKRVCRLGGNAVTHVETHVSVQNGFAEMSVRAMALFLPKGHLNLQPTTNRGDLATRAIFTILADLPASFKDKCFPPQAKGVILTTDELGLPSSMLDITAEGTLVPAPDCARRMRDLLHHRDALGRFPAHAIIPLLLTTPRKQAAQPHRSERNRHVH